MIDRLARRLASRRGLTAWEALDEQDRTQFRLDAVAVLSEMRHPPASVRMDEDGLDRWTWTCHMCGGPKENWERAIDAALKGDGMSNMIGELRGIMRDPKYSTVDTASIIAEIREVLRKHNHSDTYYDWLKLLPAVMSEEGGK